MYSESQESPVRAFRAQWIVPVSSAPIDDGLIITDRDRILAVGSYESLHGQLEVSPIDLGKAIVFPGFINLHTHLEDEKLPESPQDVLHYLEQSDMQASSLNVEQRREIIRHNIDECEQFGTVALGDFASDALSGEVLPDSSLFARIFQQIRGFKNYEAATIFREYHERVMQYPPQKKVTSHLAMASTWELSPELLQEISMHERHIAIHMAMTEDENEFMSRGQGALRQYLLSKGDFDYTWVPPRKSPVQYFFSNCFYTRHNILVHLNNINDRDIEIIKETPAKVNVCLCPRSIDSLNLKNPPVKQILEKGVNICMGTESAAIVEDLDMRKETITAVDKFGITPEVALKFATLNGAYAIGFHKEVGSLDAGKSFRCLVVEIEGAIQNDPYMAILNSSQPVRWLADIQ